MEYLSPAIVFFSSIKHFALYMIIKKYTLYVIGSGTAAIQTKSKSLTESRMCVLKYQNCQITECLSIQKHIVPNVYAPNSPMILPSHHLNCFIFFFKIISGFVMLNWFLVDYFQYYFLCSNCDHIQRTPTQIRCANANFPIIPCTIVCKFNSHSMLEHYSTREVCNSEIDLVRTNCDAHRLFRLNISLIFLLI